MKNKKVVFISLSALALAVSFFSLQNTPSDELANTYQPDQAYQSNQSVSSDTLSPVASATMKPAVLSADEVFISEGVKQQMADIADNYRENSRYPSYSTLLYKSDWSQLNPRAFIPKAIPLAFDETLSAEIVLDKYIVSTDERLDVTLRIKGSTSDRYGESLGASQVSVSLSQNDLMSGARQLHLIEEAIEGVSTYKGTIPASDFKRFAEGEALLSADMSFSNDEVARVSAGLKLASNIATLVGLDSPYIEGAHLVIPALFDVKEKGFYRLQANLFDESGEEPISHLNASFMLEGSRAEGEIKVHASTLRAKGNAGPYLLKDIDLTRGPARPGDKTAYGSSASETYAISGFDLDAYSHEEYIDPKAQQRLEFLQKMAGIQ